MRGVIAKKKSPLVRLYLLPPIAKFMIALLLFVLLDVAGFFYLHHESIQQTQRLNMQRSLLEKEITQQARHYGEMVYLSQDATRARQMYTAAIKQFPGSTEIDTLLASITKLGTAERLKFIHFKPGGTINNGYYASVEVNISVIGQFHHIGKFLSGVANLPNSVVAVNQFSLSHANDKDNLLTLNFTATLYHTLPNSLDINP